MTQDDKEKIAANLKGKVRADVVRPMLEAGFEPYHTGGGCMAWRREESDSSNILITYGHDAMDGDPAEKEWGLGRYSDETEDFVQLSIDPEMGTGLTLAEAVTASDRFPAIEEDEQLTFDTIDEAMAYVPSVKSHGI